MIALRRFGVTASSTWNAGAAPLASSCRRWIGEQSWGADLLKRSGEKLDSDGKAPKDIFMSKEIIAQCPDNVKALGDELLQLNVLEIRAVLARLQNRLGIRDDQLDRGGGGGGSGGAQIAASAAPAAAAAAAAPPKEAFDIKLGAVDAKIKIKVIKEVRVITGLGLAESKALVEKAPCVIKEGVKKEEADKIKKLLVDAGAIVELV